MKSWLKKNSEPLNWRLIGWIGAGLVIFGYYLNANEYIASWLIWIGRKYYGRIYSIYKKAYSTAVMSFILTIMNIYGVYPLVIMNSITAEKDFPSAKNFVYLNAANVSLMYSGAENGIQDWFEDVALNGSNNFDDNAEQNFFKKPSFGSLSINNHHLIIFLQDPALQSY
ncbi:MAG: hypothetical protein Ct9H300mP18_07010 [Candidatus Neomarinimicrobiota bacterium]|nr:MAG: hypothetical protein Ct9H300mP18_07010 [Candidatus Neomarinimicrobiota bacterium]